MIDLNSAQPALRICWQQELPTSEVPTHVLEVGLRTLAMHQPPRLMRASIAEIEVHNTTVSGVTQMAYRLFFGASLDDELVEVRVRLRAHVIDSHMWDPRAITVPKTLREWQLYTFRERFKRTTDKHNEAWLELARALVENWEPEGLTKTEIRQARALVERSVLDRIIRFLGREKGRLMEVTDVIKEGEDPLDLPVVQLLRHLNYVVSVEKKSPLSGRHYLVVSVPKGYGMYSPDSN